MDKREKGNDNKKEKEAGEALKRISYDTITSGLYAPESISKGRYNLTSATEKKERLMHSYDEKAFSVFKEMDSRDGLISYRQQDCFSTYRSAYLRDSAITDLEQVLSAYYKSDAIITKIQDIDVTRKVVKEVFFLLGNRLSKVWIFKSEPKKTSSELYIYHVAYEEGIPTGKPIGYDPEKEYDYDVAIIGGIVEHAGESYNKLIENLQRKPEMVFSTARSISSMIFDYQTKLTENLSKLRKGGLDIKKFDVKKKLDETLLKSGITGNDNAVLLKSSLKCLHDMQNSKQVVSHGDTHTGNILTINEFDMMTNQFSAYIDRFGIIDWESLCLDTPYSDLVDFWIHHERTVRKIMKNYDYRLNNFITAENDKDATIQSALWHVFEMYDPVRKNKRDIREKFSYHRAKALDALDALRGMNPAREAYNIINYLEI